MLFEFALAMLMVLVSLNPSFLPPSVYLTEGIFLSLDDMLTSLEVRALSNTASDSETSASCLLLLQPLYLISSLISEMLFLLHFGLSFSVSIRSLILQYLHWTVQSCFVSLKRKSCNYAACVHGHLHMQK